MPRRVFSTALVHTALFFSAGIAAVDCAKAGTAAGDDVVDSGPNQKPDSSSMDANVMFDSGPGSDTGGSCTTVPPSNVCGLDPQCGCGPSSTCDVNQVKLDGTTSCVASASSGGVKSPCTSKDATGCAPGLTCVFGVCRPYCSMDGQPCSQPGTGACLQLTKGMNMPIPNFLVCRVDCTLDDANSCGGNGIGCIYDSTVTDGTNCYPTGNSTTTCNMSSPFCAPGYECVTINMATSCKPWCRIGGSTCGNKTCTGFMPQIIVKGVEFGVCN